LFFSTGTWFSNTGNGGFSGYSTGGGIQCSILDWHFISETIILNWRYYMTSKAKLLANEALHLSPNDRAILADSLLVSLDQPDPKIDALWKTEVEKRLRDYTSGKIKAVPLSKVLGNYRKKKAA
jgi:putative addiction module component (TIGR02574 family)